MNDSDVLYYYIIIKVDSAFNKGVKYPSIPCFSYKDMIITVYPLKGSDIAENYTVNPTFLDNNLGLLPNHIVNSLEMSKTMPYHCSIYHSYAQPIRDMLLQ